MEDNWDRRTQVNLSGIVDQETWEQTKDLLTSRRKAERDGGHEQNFSQDAARSPKPPNVLSSAHPKSRVRPPTGEVDAGAP
jgi:hypothetical protein